MITQEQLEMKGRLTIQVKDLENQLLHEKKVDNDIVVTGRELVARLFIENSNSGVTHMAVGRGTTAQTATDVALEDEIALTRKPLKAFTEDDLVTTAGDRKLLRVSMDLEPGEADGENITEAALFNDANDIMYNRVAFPVISKTNNIKLTLIWEITF